VISGQVTTTRGSVKGASHEFDLICIGSGPAGQRAAVQAAKLRKRVAIVERGLDVGGVCVHTGTIPSKTFREAVLSFTGHSKGAAYASSHEGGIGQDDRPTADQLLSRVGAIVKTEARVQQDQLRRNNVDIVAGTASMTGPNGILVHGPSGNREMTTENVIIAVGTKPSPNVNMPTGLPNVITSDEILKLKELPRSMIVVGCGVIGVEYASMFAALGVKVTVVDGRERPLEFLDGEIVDELIHQMRRNMVTFRLGESVERIDHHEGPPEQALVFRNLANDWSPIWFWPAPAGSALQTIWTWNARVSPPTFGGGSRWVRTFARRSPTSLPWVT
jgi:NAD(P) transhydrogenase